MVGITAYGAYVPKRRLNRMAIIQSMAWLAPGLDVAAVHPEECMVNTSSMDAWRERGYRVNAWTVDDPQRLRRVAGLGVDTIISNDPAAALRALASA